MNLLTALLIRCECPAVYSQRSGEREFYTPLHTVDGRDSASKNAIEHEHVTCLGVTRMSSFKSSAASCGSHPLPHAAVMLAIFFPPGPMARISRASIFVSFAR